MRGGDMAQPALVGRWCPRSCGGMEAGRECPAHGRGRPLTRREPACRRGTRPPRHSANPSNRQPRGPPAGVPFTPFHPRAGRLKTDVGAAELRLALVAGCC